MLVWSKRKAFSLYPPIHPEHKGALDAFVAAATEATTAGPFTLNLHLGKASFRLLATDLTEGYVHYNKGE